MSSETYAIVRPVSRSITRCELTHLHREAIDLERARAQHRIYTQCLQEAGYALIELAEQADLPDAVFVEDTAIVLDELAIITRPGAISRRPELPSVAQALLPFRTPKSLLAPATLDGGDVLVMGRTLFVGLSLRTNEEGTRQLADQVRPFGYKVVPVPIHGCLHLKSAVSRIAPDLVLVNPDWLDVACFKDYNSIAVASDEPHAANALPLEDTILFPDAFPRTAESLLRHGLPLRLLDMSELAKAEGAVTCCSIIFRR